MITTQDLERIGLEKILEFMDLEDKEDLRIFMVENRIPTLILLAEYLSTFAVVCQYCHQDLVPIIYETLICGDCYDIIEEKDKRRFHGE